MIWEVFEAELFGLCLSFKSLNIHFYKSNIFIYSYYWLSFCYFYTHWDMTRLIRISGPKPNGNKSQRGVVKHILSEYFENLWREGSYCFGKANSCVSSLLHLPHINCNSNSQDMMKRINRQSSRMICPKSDISVKVKREYKETQPQPHMLIREPQKAEMQWHEALWEYSLQQTLKSTKVLTNRSSN